MTWQLKQFFFIPCANFSQIIFADTDLVQTSCGYGVPLYNYTGDQDIHFDWADKKGKKGLETYMKEKNRISPDGLPTKLMVDEPGIH